MSAETDEPQRPTRVLGLSFTLAGLAALGLLFISEMSHHRSVAALAETQALYLNRSEINRLLRATVDLETSQRGYLLTGRDAYLEPQEKAKRAVDVSIAALRAHADQHLDQRPLYEALFKVVRERISVIDETIRLGRAGRDEAAIALIETDIGNEKQDQIRDAVAAMVAAENARLTLREAQVAESLMLSRLGVATLTALSLLAFYFYLQQTRLRSTERERRAAELQKERDGLELEVKRRTKDLRILADNLQDAQEEERAYIARELHDELGALFTSAKLDVARLQARLGSAMTPEIAERLGHLKGALNSGVELKRQLIEDLRPSSLAHFGLQSALNILTREMAQRSGLVIEARIAPLRLSDEGDLTVYRLVQEALTNVVKYAKARRVEVDLGLIDDGAEIVVVDDGVGFDPGHVRRAAHGLTGMRFRVEAAGGRMTVHSALGEGTSLRAWLPLLRPEDMGDSEPGALVETSDVRDLPRTSGTG